MEIRNSISIIVVVVVVIVVVVVVIVVVIISAKPGRPYSVRSPGRPVLGTEECMTEEKLGIANYAVKPSCWRSTVTSSPDRSWWNSFRNYHNLPFQAYSPAVACNTVATTTCFVLPLDDDCSFVGEPWSSSSLLASDQSFSWDANNSTQLLPRFIDFFSVSMSATKRLWTETSRTLLHWTSHSADMHMLENVNTSAATRWWSILTPLSALRNTLQDRSDIRYTTAIDRTLMYIA